MRNTRNALIRLVFTIFLTIGVAGVPSHVHARTADDVVTYRMEAGDTLNAINSRYLASTNAVADVARLNRISNPRRIPVGTVLRLPRRLLAWRSADLVVRSFSGPVNIDGSVPQIGAPLAEGAIIQTGRNGFIAFQSADGATVALPSNSHARLERARIYRLRDLRDVEFRILGGRGTINAPVLRDEERFRTSTPVAVTAVRGTQYRVGFDANTSMGVTEVIEGTVSVGGSTADEGAEGVESEGQLTEAGFGVAASAAGVTAPEALLPPAEIESPGAIQTGEVVSFAVTLPAGALATRTQIARDAGFLEVIAEQIGSAQATDFEGIEDGRYFVRSRGISNSGIEGLSETFSFRRKRLGAEAVVEPSPLADGFRFAWLPQGEGITHFAFQLWREGEADRPLYDEIALPGSATVITGLEPGSYLWRVAAIQSDAEEGLLQVWGPEQSLTVSPE
ncbi:FecR domain-containing protein [Erythrobacter alti]|uniref:FecR domain-containing protein n=1 Tax=Erythrobacter alti TaxID=1896145 RepID=UPI0030F49A69